jgi:hypothetical protein
MSCKKTLPENWAEEIRTISIPMSHSKKVMDPIRKPPCNAYCYRLAFQSTLALHSSSCACPFCPAAPVVFVSHTCKIDD